MSSTPTHDISDSDDSECEYVTLAERLAPNTGHDRLNHVTGSSRSPGGDTVNLAGTAVSDREIVTQKVTKDGSPVGFEACGLKSSECVRSETGQSRKRATATSKNEKLQKKARNCEQREQRPDNCEKFLEVLVSAGVVAVDGAVEVLQHLKREAVSSVVDVKQPAPCLSSSVMWRRRVNSYRVENDQVVSSSSYQMEPQLVMLCSASAIRSPRERQKACRTVSEAIVEFDSMTEGAVRATLLCCGKLSSSLVTDLSCSLLTTARCCIHVADTPALAATFLTHMTRSVALTPHRRSQTVQQFSWFADSCQSVKVDGQLRGLKQLWLQQLRQLPGSSLAAAGRIAEEFRSPALLRKAYSECGSEEARHALVARLQIERFSGPLTSHQAIGAELSRRLCLLVTAAEGDTVL